MVNFDFRLKKKMEFFAAVAVSKPPDYSKISGETPDKIFKVLGILLTRKSKMRISVVNKAGLSNPSPWHHIAPQTKEGVFIGGMWGSG